MPDMATTVVVESKVDERLILALLLSIGLHLALMFAIQAQPSDSAGNSPTPIAATLERVSSSEDSAAAPSEPEAIAPTVAESSATEPAEVTPAPRQPSPAEIEPPLSPQPSKPEPSETRPALEIPVIRDPTYYAARFLDEYPRPLSPVEPRYPERASRDDISGTVTLLLLIDETGTLNEITVVAATPGAIFDAAAMAAFRAMRFSPARKDGRAVRSRVLITVGFDAGKGATLQ